MIDVHNQGRVNGAVFFSGTYGSTAQYASWVGAESGLPVFDINDREGDPSNYDYLVLGSSVIVYKLTIRKWLRRKLASIINKPVILFTVAGAPAGPKLDAWVAASVPRSVFAQTRHVALRGRQDPAALSWWHRLILIAGAWKNTDPVARKQELEGFDFMDRSSIAPILDLVRQLQSGAAATENAGTLQLRKDEGYDSNSA